MADSTLSVTYGHAGPSPAGLPAADPAAARPEEIRRNSLDGGALAGTKVLLVDDDYRNLFAIKALLERARTEVKIAASGLDAFYALQRTPDINIVLMDIMMPEMDGYQPRHNGCDSAQGYYFSRPQPADKLVTWLTESPFGASAAINSRSHHPTCLRAQANGEPQLDPAERVERPLSMLGIRVGKDLVAPHEALPASERCDLSQPPDERDD
jgi:Response regulator receiver domain